jgi:hypothetical protein
MYLCVRRIGWKTERTFIREPTSNVIEFAPFPRMVEPEAEGDPVVIALAEARQRVQILAIKVGLAACEIIAVFGFLALHRALESFVVWLMPSSWGLPVAVVGGAFEAAFVVIGIHLAYDTVVIFFPSLRARNWASDDSDDLRQ